MNTIINALSERERKTIYECLCAAEQGDFFPAWEFETLFGITINQLSSVRERWPEVDIQQSDVGAAVVGAMNHLLGYPHGQDEHWDKFISVQPDVVKLTLEKLLALGL